MLNLERQDLLQLDPISSTSTIKLLPLGKKFKQKLVIGDDSGTLSVYEFKKGEPQVVFQVKVFETPISSVSLGGPMTKKDKIFVSSGQRIVGYTKKGNEFFKLTSSLSEPIHNIFVEESRIWTSCEYIYNMFDNGQDAAFFMSRDQINCMIVEHVTKDSDLDALLGCRDNCIRVVHGSNCLFEIHTSSGVTALGCLPSSMSSLKKAPLELLVGQETGLLQLLRVQSSGAFEEAWAVEDPKKTEITCLKACDLTKSKCNDIVVGRGDGRVEVFALNPTMSGDIFPELIFSKNIGESVRGVDCGVVNTAGFSEIVVASYSGKIISFTAEPVLQRAQEDTHGRSIQTVSNENRIKHLRKELDGLRQKIEKEKEKLRKTTAKSTVSSTSNTGVARVARDFPIISNFTLDKDQAAFILTVELLSPIDVIILRSPVNLDIIDSDIGSTVVSITPPHLLQIANGLTAGSSSDDVPNKFVAAFRCQNEERRVSLTLRSAEGEFGDLCVTVVADGDPKQAKLLRFALRPLSLHSKLHAISEEEMARPRSRIKFSGTFNIGVAHEWVQSLFADVPPNIDETTSEQSFVFKNVFTGGVTTCEIRRNEVVIESQSASTIAISKETITRMANTRRIQIEEAVLANDQSIISFLALVRERLEHQLSLARKMDLVEAVQEITMQDGDSSWLSEEYSAILRDAPQIRTEFKARARSLEYLNGIITDLFVDWNRLRGVEAKHRIPELQQAILSPEFSFDGLVRIFLSAPPKSSKPSRMKY